MTPYSRRPPGDLERLLDLRPLVHRAERAVASRLGADVRHPQAASPRQLPRAGREAGESVGPRVAPVRKAGPRERLEHRDRRLLAVEEVVVVELDRVGSVAVAKRLDRGEHSRRTGEKRLPSEHRDDAAEGAAVAAADRGLVDARSAAEKRARQVGRDVAEAFDRQRRESVGLPPRAIRLVDDRPVPLPGDPANAGEIEPAAPAGSTSVVDTREHLEQGLLACSADDHVDVGRVEGSLRVEGREVASPRDRDVREPVANRLGDRDRRADLRPRHDGEADQGVRGTVEMRENGPGCVGVEVPVHQGVIPLPLEDRAQGEEGEGKARVLRGADARVDEEDGPERGRAHAAPG